MSVFPTGAEGRMDGFGGGNVLTPVRSAWLFERIVETGSVVLSCVGGDHAETAAAHRSLGSPQSDVPTILATLRPGRWRRAGAGAW
ncbi:hypothetical protein [Methylobacterium sp. J-072]|uniref:hypothetical protein n=1 Tax=Methylobacterium sp. J-072 TaxID=2836651 RepID=UPI001FBAFF0F|nr:hypothetical protein [Methylobacterium sp. J-072]